MSITPEQAADRAAAELRSMYSTVTTWDTAILDQVVLHLADSGQPFGMNQIRLVVPEDACKKAGLYFHVLVTNAVLHPAEPELLRKVGEEVSINPKAHGKKVNLYVLTRAGRKYIDDRKADRAEQRRAA